MVQVFLRQHAAFGYFTPHTGGCATVPTLQVEDDTDLYVDIQD